MTCSPAMRVDSRNLRNQIFPDRKRIDGGGMVLFGNQDKKRLFCERSPRRRGESKKKIKSSNTDNRCNWRPWDELLPDILFLVLKRLDLVDSSSFSGVCRRWKSLAVSYKQDYAESQPPLILTVTSSDNGDTLTSHSYNIFDDGDSTCKNILPSIKSSFFVYASSCGYLITLVSCPPAELLIINSGPVCSTISQLWLLNPMTRQIYHFPHSPHPLDRVIIASSSSISGWQWQWPWPWPSSPDDLVIVGIGNDHSNIQIYRSRDAKWDVHSYDAEGEKIVDIATFKGKIYFLTRDAGVGTLKLTPHDGPILVPLQVNKRSPPPPCASEGGYILELVASDEKLLMVVYLENKLISVYELDFLKMEWHRVESLGDDQALFTGNKLGYSKSSALIKNPARWGCRSNCIYHLDFEAKCSVYSLGGKLLQSFPVLIEQPANGFPYWYFPHQFCNIIDSLYDDDVEEVEEGDEEEEEDD